MALVTSKKCRSLFMATKGHWLNELFYQAYGALVPLFYHQPDPKCKKEWAIRETTSSIV